MLLVLAATWSACARSTTSGSTCRLFVSRDTVSASRHIVQAYIPVVFSASSLCPLSGTHAHRIQVLRQRVHYAHQLQGEVGGFKQVLQTDQQQQASLGDGKGLASTCMMAAACHADPGTRSMPCSSTVEGAICEIMSPKQTGVRRQYHGCVYAGPASKL